MLTRKHSTPSQLYNALETVLFWLAILLGAVAVVSAGVLLACHCLRLQVPLALFVPAPALIVWMVSMGPVSYAAAVLFAGDVGQALLACLLLLLMLCTLCVALYMLRRWLTLADASMRRALFVRQGPRQPGSWWPHLYDHPWCACCCANTDTCNAFTPLRFLARFGVLFAAAQGPALEPTTGATYASKDPRTGWVAVPKLRSAANEHWTRRLPAMLVLLFKMGVAGLVCGCNGGQSVTGSVAQASVLLVVVVLQLAYVILARPWNGVYLQAAMTGGAALETAMVACFVATTAAPSLAVSNALVALVVLGVTAYGVLLLGLLGAPLVRRWTMRKRRRWVAVVDQVVRGDAHYLQRKYADRYGQCRVLLTKCTGRIFTNHTDFPPLVPGGWFASMASACLTAPPEPTKQRPPAPLQSPWAWPPGAVWCVPAPPPPMPLWATRARCRACLASAPRQAACCHLGLLLGRRCCSGKGPTTEPSGGPRTMRRRRGRWVEAAQRHQGAVWAPQTPQKTPQIRRFRPTAPGCASPRGRIQRATCWRTSLRPGCRRRC